MLKIMLIIESFKDLFFTCWYLALSEEIIFKRVVLTYLKKTPAVLLKNEKRFLSHAEIFCPKKWHPLGYLTWLYPFVFFVEILLGKYTCLDCWYFRDLLPMFSYLFKDICLSFSLGIPWESSPLSFFSSTNFAGGTLGSMMILRS